MCVQDGKTTDARYASPPPSGALPAIGRPTHQDPLWHAWRMAAIILPSVNVWVDDSQTLRSVVSRVVPLPNERRRQGGAAEAVNLGSEARGDG